MSRYDIAIIGTGPAGISAAITATIRNKRIVLIGSEPHSSKMLKAGRILNYPGLPNITGEDFASAMDRHLSSMDIRIEKCKVAMIYSMGDYFALQTSNEFIEASSVILATGVVIGKTIPGEEEYLGKGVSYCATCDAALYKGKEVAVIGYTKKEEAEADFLTEYAKKVIYLPMYSSDTDLNDQVTVIREKPVSIQGDQFVTALQTDKGAYEVDGVFVLRDSIAPSNLVPGLETDGGHVRVNRLLETNIPGLFACGDITGRPYQYVKAAGEGNVAALSAVEWLGNKNGKN